MENAGYIALSRQMTLRRELDIAANNLANMDTAGFKVEELLVATENGERARNFGIEGPGRFVLDTGLGRDFGQGVLSETGNTFDFAIEGAGFFAIGGPEGERYTRDGRFSTDANGRLVTADGLPVLGEGGAEIILDMSKGAPSVSDDGIITQGEERVGRLQAVQFTALGVLSKDGDGYYRNTSNETPSPAEGARVRQGMVEGSNVQPIRQITNLIEITRAYESMAKMIESTNDLNRRTVERLGRVS
ncbi:MAG: flagellar basal-body rod protein FlgF [Caulobacteraceae bacterium]|nr:flagellar basal-body rod protein FlgF [Caulobacteraceae bacterium]